MTVEQFNKTAFSKETLVLFRGETFQITGIDFETKRITYKMKIGDSSFDTTKDCEAIEIVEEPREFTPQAEVNQHLSDRGYARSGEF